MSGRTINSMSFLNTLNNPSFWIGRKWWVSNHIYQVYKDFKIIIIQVIYKKKHVKNWLIWELLGLRLEFIITIVVDIQTLRWRLRLKSMYLEPIFDLQVLKEKMSSETRRFYKENKGKCFWGFSRNPQVTQRWRSLPKLLGLFRCWVPTKMWRSISHLRCVQAGKFTAFEPKSHGGLVNRWFSGFQLGDLLGFRPLILQGCMYAVK